MPPSQDASALLARALADPDAGWAVGTFGAIGEFVRDRGEPAAVDARSAVTARGGIAAGLAPGTRAIAWERPTVRGAWQHGIAFCLPRDEAPMHRRRVLTPLGRDRDALREGDREAFAYDLGLGTMQCDVCIRVADAHAARALDGAAGRAALDGGLLRELAAMQPHRVFVSRLARVEVYTPIPAADGVTPAGPHTHVLPALLRLGRTHPANLPLPDGWVPALELFPPSPLREADGQARPFDAGRHAAFQRLLEDFGDARAVAAKRSVAAAVAAGEAPREDARFGRAERLARRVVLRQLALTLAPSPALAAWRARFDAAEREGAASRWCG
jgi:hypothetical protein